VSILRAPRRTTPIRRLTPAERDRLGWSGAHQIARVEYRSLIGIWRPSKWFSVETSQRDALMVATAGELARYDVRP
jgi:hypothetical protein